MTRPTQTLFEALATTGGDCRTLPQIQALSGLGRQRVQKGLDILKRRGLVDRISRGCYRLNDDGRAALTARLKINGGGNKRTNTRKPGLQDRLWGALRRMRKGSIPELLSIADARDLTDAMNEARRYLRALCNAGFVTLLSTKEPGTAKGSKGHLRYALVRDTGPRTPWLRARRGSGRTGELVDPNTGETHRCR